MVMHGLTKPKIPLSLNVPCFCKMYECVGYYKVLCICGYKHLNVIAYTGTGGATHSLEHCITYRRCHNETSLELSEASCVDTPSEVQNIVYVAGVPILSVRGSRLAVRDVLCSPRPHLQIMNLYTTKAVHHFRR